MPINYLELQPQITEYCQRAGDEIANRPGKIAQAIMLLKQLAQELKDGLKNDLSSRVNSSSVNRCALPAAEAIDLSYKTSSTTTYALLASDGSQITSNHHDALPVSLINTSTVFMQFSKGTAPEIQTQSEFLRDDDGALITDFINEKLVNTTRDVREINVLANYPYNADNPLIVLSDGPLELFQEPRSEAKHLALFKKYLQALFSLSRQARITAGYTDKPRADLVIKMLEWVYAAQADTDMSNITDTHVFSEILSPGERSAIFLLHSPSSKAYRGEIQLHFFYLNVGTEKYPWIVRIEIPSGTAHAKEAIALLQKALLDQCALMGTRPYPYILHRAHEEAVVSFQEREQLINSLTHTLFDMGFPTTSISNKQDAKDLGKRTRLK